MLYCPITSGSKGNCHLIKGDDTIILIDAGTTAKNLTAQLATLGVCPADLSGILITHEHIDHISAVDVLSRKHGIPIFCNRGTMAGIQKRFPSLNEQAFRLFNTDEEFFLSEFSILPFKTPHDAAESVGYAVRCADQKMTVATDIGYMTPNVFKNLEGAQLVALESNHDREMLINGPYPFNLKRRIMGHSGHLSNEECGKTLARLALSGLKQAVLCHLSQENNTPELASRTVEQEVISAGRCDLPIDIAYQEKRGAVYVISP